MVTERDGWSGKEKIQNTLYKGRPIEVSTRHVYIYIFVHLYSQTHTCTPNIVFLQRVCVWFKHKVI